MDNADSEQVDFEVAPDILPQEKAKPTRDDEKHHAARIPAHNDVETQAIHRRYDKGKQEDRVRHAGCDSVIQW